MRALLVVTMVLPVAACASAGPADRVADPSVPPPTTRATPLPTPRPGEARVRPPAPTPLPRPTRETPTREAPARETRPAAPPLDLARFGGATESAVAAAVGNPDAVRDQPPGKVWIYNQGTCRLEVFLYPSVDVGSMAVLGTAMLPDTLSETERDRCRRALARRTIKSQ